MDFAQILPRLFVGSHPATVEDIEGLRRNLAATAVLNLQTDEDMSAVGLDFKPLEAHYRTSPIRLVRVPMMEEQPVMREKLPDCIRALEGLLAADHTVYLHCTAGIGRSPTVAIGYLHWCMGWGLDAAVSHVKQARQCSPHLEALRLAIRQSQGAGMQEEIGLTAGRIWHVLDAKGELSLAQLKKKVIGKTPVFDWAVGWLAREDKIVITPEKRSFRVRLKETQVR